MNFTLLTITVYTIYIMANNTIKKIPLKRDFIYGWVSKYGNTKFPPQYYKEFFPIQKKMQTILFTFF
jgi:hypothetical protein